VSIPPSPVEEVSEAAITATQITSGLSTGQYGFLVDDNVIMSSQVLPPLEPSPSVHQKIKEILSMANPPPSEEWPAVKKVISALQDDYHTNLAHNALQEIYCRKLRVALAAKEKSKGQKRKAQQLLGSKLGRILTGDAMIEALRQDEEARAQKESNSQEKQALKELRAAYNAWKAGVIAEKAAKHAQNIAEWELKCLALPPGAKKPKKPTQPKRQNTPARFKTVSRRKKQPGRHVIGESDEYSSENESEEYSSDV
jgi:Ni/Co efflux regulator RcnB